MIIRELANLSLFAGLAERRGNKEVFDRPRKKITWDIRDNKISNGGLTAWLDEVLRLSNSEPEPMIIHVGLAGESTEGETTWNMEYKYMRLVYVLSTSEGYEISIDKGNASSPYTIIIKIDPMIVYIYSYKGDNLVRLPAHKNLILKILEDRQISDLNQDRWNTQYKLGLRPGPKGKEAEYLKEVMGEEHPLVQHIDIGPESEGIIPNSRIDIGGEGIIPYSRIVIGVPRGESPYDIDE